MTMRPTTEDLLSLGDFQRTNMWEVSLLPPIPSFLNIDSNGFKMRCRSSTIPRWTQSAIEIFVRSNRMYDTNVMYPDGTITLSFIEHVDAPIRRMIFAWEDAVRNRLTNLRDLCCDIRLVTMNNHEDANTEYILKYAFLEESNLGELAGTESGASLMFPEITIKYNILERKVVDGIPKD